MGMIGRLGVGRVKHLQIRWLWIQEMAKSGKLKVSKVPTADNTSDVGTKYLPVLSHQQHTEGLGVFSERAIFPEVQELHMLSGPGDGEEQYRSSDSDEGFQTDRELFRRYEHYQELDSDGEPVETYSDYSPPSEYRWPHRGDSPLPSESEEWENEFADASPDRTRSGPPTDVARSGPDTDFSDQEAPERELGAVDREMGTAQGVEIGAISPETGEVMSVQELDLCLERLALRNPLGLAAPAQNQVGVRNEAIQELHTAPEAAMDPRPDPADIGVEVGEVYEWEPRPKKVCRRDVAVQVSRNLLGMPQSPPNTAVTETEPPSPTSPAVPGTVGWLDPDGQAAAASLAGELDVAITGPPEEVIEAFQEEEAFLEHFEGPELQPAGDKQSFWDGRGPGRYCHNPNGCRPGTSDHSATG